MQRNAGGTSCLSCLSRIAAYLDRANFSFASAAGITEDTGITKGISSLLGALFFLGYFFFQIPGAIYAERRSVRKPILSA